MIVFVVFIVVSCDCMDMYSIVGFIGYWIDELDMDIR